MVKHVKRRQTGRKDTPKPARAGTSFKKSFVLPFATPGANRVKEFTRNMELASVLYLAESNREKGESPLMKKTDEKIVFLAEARYPLWLVPYDTAHLVFDGLALFSHSFIFDVAPDCEIFNRDIVRKQKTTEGYTAALSRNIGYFGSFRRQERIQIDGLITDSELRNDLRNFFPRMRETRKPLTTSVVLSPTIESHEIQAAVRQLSNLRKRNNADIESIDGSMKLLNATTARRIKAIRKEIKKTLEAYNKEIKKSKPGSTRRILQIQNRYNRKIVRASKGFNKRLLNLSKNQAKNRKTLRHLRTEGKRCETRIQHSRRHKRKEAEAQWALRLARIKKKIQVLRREIEVCGKRIREVETAQKLELAKQRIECLASIESANKMFLNLQGSKEAEVLMKRQEIATLEDTTRCITKSMQEMALKKKAFREEFDKAKMLAGKRGRRLVYLPFYLARYEKGEKKRYALYPPAVVGDMGILTKMKGALGAAKVKVLLQPRSEAISAFLNQLLVRFEKKPMLEKTVTETGIRNSILLRRQLRVGVKKGLKELENERWISRDELQTISRVLYIYSSSMNRPKKAILISENDYLTCLPTVMTG